MQTFLPESVAFPRKAFELSASVLDYRRLGKQRLETKQILETLLGRSSGWRNHPAVRMWIGYEGALAQYGYTMCEQWVSRGYNDTLRLYFYDLMLELPIGFLPPWVGDPAFHRSHQSNLVRKDPQHYRRYYPDVPDDLPYVWPATDGEWL